MSPKYPSNSKKSFVNLVVTKKREAKTPQLGPGNGSGWIDDWMNGWIDAKRKNQGEKLGGNTAHHLSVISESTGEPSTPTHLIRRKAGGSRELSRERRELNTPPCHLMELPVSCLDVTFDHTRLWLPSHQDPHWLGTSIAQRRNPTWWWPKHCVLIHNAVVGSCIFDLDSLGITSRCILK
ncbi:uncharacterized protein LOC113008271 isoform X2 [Astatotilapia calliptera]|uniref:uncharacterized protein LOC113008271 isoform X2 n=1 Tax=Astatotilapia calliptera TaxID=8154 RepID=UPI000E41F977|nr:uncharacterized protein LOC113008271 isoform X2 [Astatotilapia calliptera]